MVVALIRHRARLVLACPELFLQIGSLSICRPGWIASLGVGDPEVLESRPAVDATGQYR